MKHHISRGFFLIEVVVASAVIAVVLMLLLGSIQNSVEASRRSLERTQVSYILEEGAEAVKSIRDTDWATITALSNDTTYYLVWSGNSWTLSTTPQSIEVFTRSVSLDPVYRSGTDDIVASGGTLDTGTRKVTITTTWSSSSGDKSEDLSFYITDIR